MEKDKLSVIANISNHHVHLSETDMEKLFGAGSKLTKERGLLQPGQFASTECVTLKGPSGKIEKVRLLGPIRKRTQVEISRTDSFRLGINPPVRDSGNVEGSAPIIIIGPAGTVNLQEGCIIAWRHIHMTPRDAELFGVKDKDLVRVKTSGPRSVIFENTLIRVRDDFALECHIDTDEANTCDLKNGDTVSIV